MVPASNNPPRILFGVGTIEDLADEVERLDAHRALVISTPRQIDQAERIRELLGERGAAIFFEAAMHTPVEVTGQVTQIVERDRIDCLVAIGGGSTTGLSKAVALRTGLPQVIIATTYAGSEMTPILGQTEDGVKTTLVDDGVIPDVVIYDVELTLSLPPAFSGVSGINAIAHAVEALYAKERSDAISSIRLEAARLDPLAYAAVPRRSRACAARRSAGRPTGRNRKVLTTCGGEPN